MIHALVRFFLLHFIKLEPHNCLDRFHKLVPLKKSIVKAFKVNDIHVTSNNIDELNMNLRC